jgi:hypothetical protein
VVLFCSLIGNHSGGKGSTVGAINIVCCIRLPGVISDEAIGGRGLRIPLSGWPYMR